MGFIRQRRPANQWPAWRRSMLPGTWKKVGTTMDATANAQNIAALNPLGAGVTGTWANIPKASTFDGVQDGASEGFPALVNDWCGGVYNAGKLWVFGGGHNGYAGNEVISINLTDDNPAWKIERPPTGWKTSASEGISLADGLESTHIYSNGDPRSTHSYDLIAWANGGMYIMTAATFMGAERGYATANKVFKFTPGANPTIGNNASYGSWAVVNSSFTATNWNDASLTYDSTRNVLYAAMPGFLQRLDLSSGNLLSDGPGLVTSGSTRGIYISSLDLVVYLNASPASKFVLYKPSTNTVHTPGSTGTVPVPVAEPGKANTAITYEYFTAADWVPGLGCIVSRVEGGTGFETLTPPSIGDPTTTAWVWGRLAASGSNVVTPDNRNVNADFGRFFYSPELLCLAFVSATSAAQSNNPNSSGQINVFALS